MSAPRRALGAVVAAGLALALTAASGIQMRINPTSEARLRVAFSARPERVETCRALGAEELAELPQHMRQSVVCEGAAARYRLDVRHADTLLTSVEVRGGGFRRDRRLFVLQELPVPSGRSAVEVRLTRLDSATSAPRAEETDSARGSQLGGAARPPVRELEERRRRMADEVPATLVWRDTVTLAPREVLLVTYDQGARRLHAMRASR